MTFKDKSGNLLNKKSLFKALKAISVIIISAVFIFAGMSIKKMQNESRTESEVPTQSSCSYVTSSFLTDYLMVYFTGDGAGDEQIYFALSRDGFNWESLNDSKPVLTSSVGTCGVRDPFIMRKQDGSFIILATDLCIADDGDWWKCQTSGSRNIVIWESCDLVNWSEPRLVEVGKTFGCVWAPEAYWDEENECYIVFWASRVSSDNFDHLRIHYSTTTDFVEFSTPKAWIDTGKDTIDTTVIKADGKYYRYTKDEKYKKILLETSDSLMVEWIQVKSIPLSSYSGVEGPTCFALHEDDRYEIGTENPMTVKYVLLIDSYGGKGYFPLVAEDLSSGEYKKRTDYTMPGNKARHGTVINITGEEYERIKNAYSLK